MTPPTTPALPPFDDPRVKIVYDLLCEEVAPPPGQHWEGWESRRIVAALSAARSEKVEVRMLTEEERRAAIDEWQVEDYGFSVAIQRKCAEVWGLKVKEHGNGN
jgi:hypothetical protein